SVVVGIHELRVGGRGDANSGSAAAVGVPCSGKTGEAGDAELAAPGLGGTSAVPGLGGSTASASGSCAASSAPLRRSITSCSMTNSPVKPPPDPSASPAAGVLQLHAAASSKTTSRDTTTFPRAGS